MRYAVLLFVICYLFLCSFARPAASKNGGGRVVSGRRAGGGSQTDDNIQYYNITIFFHLLCTYALIRSHADMQLPNSFYFRCVLQPLVRSIAIAISPW